MRKLLFFVILAQFSACQFFNEPITIPEIDPPVIDPPVIDTGSGGQTSISCSRSVNGSNTGCIEGSGDFETVNFNLSHFENIELDFCGNIELK